eukprot:GHVS01109081.1.p1 GENE.GHVS01109081.1~~GHVS01109081.1.p1  ORF type:complete len:184 (+),score=21.67 GHVS01109081.1:32-553(+)
MASLSVLSSSSHPRRLLLIVVGVVFLAAMPSSANGVDKESSEENVKSGEQAVESRLDEVSSANGVHKESFEEKLERRKHAVGSKLDKVKNNRYVEKISHSGLFSSLKNGINGTFKQSKEIMGQAMAENKKNLTDALAGSAAVVAVSFLQRISYWSNMWGGSNRCCNPLLKTLF